MTSTASKRSRALDLSFAAVSFVSFLEIFGLGSNQTPTTIRAANHFAVALPLLVGPALLATLLSQMSAKVEYGWTRHAILACELVSAAGSIGCYLGIYYLFAAVTADGSRLFIQISSGVFLVALVLYKLHLARAILARRSG
jgi:hypothetical protein